jgi:hypothetical protein
VPVTQPICYLMTCCCSYLPTALLLPGWSRVIETLREGFAPFAHRQAHEAISRGGRPAAESLEPKARSGPFARLRQAPSLVGVIMVEGVLGTLSVSEYPPWP